MKTDTPTILIPNATSPKNLGDQAMLISLLAKIRKQQKSAKIILHSFDHSLQRHSSVIDSKPTLYSWAVFETERFAVRIGRLITLLLALLLRSNIFGVSIIRDYLNADIVIFAPGGYLRSRKGMTQSMNLLMQLVPFWIAIVFKKNTLVSPISVGPFAHAWQEQLVCKTLASIPALFTRETISQNLLLKYGVVSKQSTDLALDPNTILTRKSHKKFGLGFTVRRWGLSEKDQHNIEQVLVNTLAYVSKKYRIPLQPFVQVHAPEYGDHDKQEVERIVIALQAKGCSVLPIIQPKTPAEAETAYGRVQLLISMRLHASLLALRSGVLSILISDEHKSAGVMQDIGLEKYVFNPSILTTNELKKSAVSIIENRRKILNALKQNVNNLSDKKMEFVQTLGFLLATMRGDLKKESKVLDVTVAISAYNEEHNIKPFLESVLKQKEVGFRLKEILIVSDGSTDATAAIAKGMKNKKVRVIDAPTRIGKSDRLNYIYSRVSSDILVQSDADIVFETPFVIRDLVRTFVQNPLVGMCGGNPSPAHPDTFIEKAVNTTVEPYIKLRSRVRGGNNPLSADGRLLAFQKAFYTTLRIPSDMIANDRYSYYVCKSTGWQYRFVSTARVLFRSPQTVADQIRQNTRFLAAPYRMRRYFSNGLVDREEHIPTYLLVGGFLEQCLKHPVHFLAIVMLNRYCSIKAKFSEHALTAVWDMADTTKILHQKQRVTTSKL